MNTAKKAYCYAVGATICWSTVASAFKLTLKSLSNDIPVMLFWSSFFSLIVIGTAVVVMKKWPLVMASDVRFLLRSAGMGFLNPFLYYLVLFKAYSLLLGQQAQPLNYTWPILLTFFSAVVFKQKILKLQWLGLFLGLAGIAVISTRGRFLEWQILNLHGVVLALSSGLIWSVYWILNKRDSRPAVIKLGLNGFFGFVYLLLLVLAVRGTIELPPLQALSGTLWIGMFEMGISFVFWMKALELSRNTAKMSSIVYMSPFLSLLMLHRFAGEPFLFSSLLGLILIIAGIVFQKDKELSGQIRRDNNKY